MKRIALSIAFITVVGCSPSTPPVEVTATSTPVSVVDSPSPVAVDTPGGLKVGPDVFGREQMRARDGIHEVKVDKNSDGSYALVFNKWVSLGDGAESASGTPVAVSSDESTLKLLKTLLGTEPQFRAVGITVAEALLSERYAQWPLRAEDKPHLEALLTILKS